MRYFFAAFLLFAGLACSTEQTETPEPTPPQVQEPAPPQVEEPAKSEESAQSQAAAHPVTAPVLEGFTGRQRDDLGFVWQEDDSLADPFRSGGQGYSGGLPRPRDPVFGSLIFRWAVSDAGDIVTVRTPLHLPDPAGYHQTLYAPRVTQPPLQMELIGRRLVDIPLHPNDWDPSPANPFLQELVYQVLGDERLPRRSFSRVGRGDPPFLSTRSFPPLEGMRYALRGVENPMEIGKLFGLSEPTPCSYDVEAMTGFSCDTEPTISASGGSRPDGDELIMFRERCFCDIPGHTEPAGHAFAYFGRRLTDGVEKLLVPQNAFRALWLPENIVMYDLNEDGNPEFFLSETMGLQSTDEFVEIRDQRTRVLHRLSLSVNDSPSVNEVYYPDLVLSSSADPVLRAIGVAKIECNAYMSWDHRAEVHRVCSDEGREALDRLRERYPLGATDAAPVAQYVDVMLGLMDDTLARSTKDTAQALRGCRHLHRAAHASGDPRMAYVAYDKCSLDEADDSADAREIESLRSEAGAMFCGCPFGAVPENGLQMAEISGDPFQDEWTLPTDVLPEATRILFLSATEECRFARRGYSRILTCSDAGEEALAELERRYPPDATKDAPEHQNVYAFLAHTYAHFEHSHRVQGPSGWEQRLTAHYKHLRYLLTLARIRGDRALAQEVHDNTHLVERDGSRQSSPRLEQVRADAKQVFCGCSHAQDHP